MHDCMATSQVPKSCMAFPVEGSTLPTVFYSVFNLFLVCSVSTVLEASTVYISTGMWPDIKCAELQEK